VKTSSGFFWSGLFSPCFDHSALPWPRLMYELASNQKVPRTFGIVHKRIISVAYNDGHWRFVEKSSALFGFIMMHFAEDDSPPQIPSYRNASYDSSLFSFFSFILFRLSLVGCFVSIIQFLRLKSHTLYCRQRLGLTLVVGTKSPSRTGSRTTASPKKNQSRNPHSELPFLA
jgi:hypothetical protein